MNVAAHELVTGEAYKWLARQLGYDPAQVRLRDPNIVTLRPELSRFSGEQAFTEFTMSLFLRYHLATFPETSITLLELEPTITQKLLDIGVFEVSDIESQAQAILAALTYQEHSAVITAHFQFNRQREW